jgi:hypothetical protein
MHRDTSAFTWPGSCHSLSKFVECAREGVMVTVEQSTRSRNETKTGRPQWMRVIWPTFVVGTGFLLTFIWMGALLWLFSQMAHAVWSHMTI